MSKPETIAFLVLLVAAASAIAPLPVRKIKKARAAGVFRWGWEFLRPIDGNEGLFQTWLWIRRFDTALCVVLALLGVWGLVYVLRGGNF